MIETGSAISANGRGFGPATGPGAGATGYSAGSGAGHGGFGGDAPDLSEGAAYGSILSPVELGSGGGIATRYNHLGGTGGGAFRLDVRGTLTLDGRLSADGGQGLVGSHAGGGSGGSIWVTAGTLAGSGAISANGGAAGVANVGGGGSGGRIALYYELSSFSGAMSAHGGTGLQPGAAGTIFTKSVFQAFGILRIQNTSQGVARTPIDTPENLDALEVTGWGRADLAGLTALTTRTMSLSNGGVAYLPALVTVNGAILLQSNAQLVREGEAAATINTLADVTIDNSSVIGPIMLNAAGDLALEGTAVMSGRGVLTVTGDLSVRAGAVITADQNGHPPASGPGAGATSWNTGSGAGHGGFGGDAPDLSGGAAYGSILSPVELGSGGGIVTRYNHLGGTGGGAFRLDVRGTLTLDGRLSADGGQGLVGSHAGGGSGGSIWVTAGPLAGSGAISANGGAAGVANVGGGGSGGRIALYYELSSFSGVTSAHGGIGIQPGGAGTIFTKSSAQNFGDLLIDNGSLVLQR